MRFWLNVPLALLTNPWKLQGFPDKVKHFPTLFNISRQDKTFPDKIKHFPTKLNISDKIEHFPTEKPKHILAKIGQNWPNSAMRILRNF